MNFKILLSFFITCSLLNTINLAASAPSTVEEELAKQKKYANDLMTSINSGKYSGKQLEALKVLHQRILDFPIPTQEELNARYEEDQKKKSLAVIDRDNRKMGVLPMNAERMERNADIRDRNSRADSRGAGSSNPD
ncbi:MAG: hypothetical protein ACJ0FU_04560 [Gammaproteobacteria bacterium]|uniref:Uncharacterized protein n=1 Tax=SAR86 cluster bacterium TaxID=2030880 RepID=A0A368C1C4_9GAMM|nr:MAG: hypothetical protein DBW92_03915 [SAR86 cluster bacterium]|tara:strand:+ start:56 stop:463 length:408 start_codon:yes stop_codon:yes gene_type:complete